MKPDTIVTGDEEKFVIDSEIEVAFVLRTMVRKKTLASVYLDGENGFFLTTLLAVDAHGKRLVFDRSRNDTFNRRALEARELVFVASQDGAKVQFACRGVQGFDFEGCRVLATGLPCRLIRIQRRQYFRIAPPRESPLFCTIPLPAGEGSAQIAVLDIGCGGIGLIDHHPKIHLEPGTMHENCSIVLPGIGTVRLTVQIRNTYEDFLENGLAYKRAGGEFVSPPENMVMMIQRYILWVERERNAKNGRWD